MLEKARRDNEVVREEVKGLRLEQQQRLTQIAAQTRALHHQQENIDKVLHISHFFNHFKTFICIPNGLSGYERYILG